MVGLYREVPTSLCITIALPSVRGISTIPPQSVVSSGQLFCMGLGPVSPPRTSVSFSGAKIPRVNVSSKYASYQFLCILSRAVQSSGAPGETAACQEWQYAWLQRAACWQAALENQSPAT